MAVQQLAPVACPACNAQFSAPVQDTINGQDMAMKAAFLQGRFNVVQCPQCGSAVAADVPLMYYDLEKELALVYAPSALHLGSDDQEKAIGRITNSVVNSLPAEERKFYLLNPKRFLTLESLAKAVLEADGITEEMMQEQEARIKLLEELMQTPDEAALKAKIKENDAKFDYEFFEMLTALIQTSQFQGNANQAQALLALRNLLGRWSSKGKQAIRDIDQKIGLVVVENQEELLNKLENAQNDDDFEALVAAGHPLLDYSFFQNLTAKIDQAVKNGDSKTAEKLKSLRTKVLNIKDRHEEESRKALEHASELLQDILKSGRPDKVLANKLEQLDDAFFYVLNMNIEEARRQKQEQAAQALEMIGNMAMSMLQERYGPQQPPEAEAAQTEEKPQILTSKR